MRKLLLLLLLVSTVAVGQDNTEAVKTVAGTVNKMLDIISGDIDEPRDWDAYRNLFAPNAQKLIYKPNAKNSSNKVRAMNIEEFVRYVGPQYKKNGFLEIEIGLTINEYNGVANVFQSYTAKNLTGTYQMRGINSYQLVYFDDRWWIVSTTWTNENAENIIPNQFLKAEYQTKN